MKNDPGEPGKLMKYVEALLKTEQPEDENRAIEVLDEAYQRTKQFRFRHKIGQIKLAQWGRLERSQDRKSTRLNSSHANISYAVFCLKKKKYINRDTPNSRSPLQ